jgi:hypothetical protein
MHTHALHSSIHPSKRKEQCPSISKEEEEREQEMESRLVDAKKREKRERKEKHSRNRQESAIQQQKQRNPIHRDTERWNPCSMHRGHAVRSIHPIKQEKRTKMEADIEEFRSGAGGMGENGGEIMVPSVITNHVHMETHGK